MAEALRHTEVTRPALGREDVDVLSHWLGEPDMLREQRRAALDRYRETPVPARWRHLWKYTPPAALFPQGSVVPEAHPDPQTLPSKQSYEGGTILLRPGAAPQVTLGAGTRAKGVRVLSLAEAGKELEALKGYGELGGLVPAEHGLFEALNGAGWSTGVLVHVPQGREIADPIVIRTEAFPNQALVPRVLVIAEPRSRLTLLEDHMGGGDGASFVGVTEIFADQAATVQHALLQRWVRPTTGHLTVRGAAARDASLETVVLSLGGQRAKLDLGARLTEPGARSEIRGVVLGDADQHMDHHTVHEHAAPHTGSNIDLKVVLGGVARSSYTGRIRIAENASNAEAYQENRNLLLTETARADTIPELEILTDEVSCTHGATVAPSDPEQLFYLQSRGLSRAKARELILEGFVATSVERLPAAVRDRVGEVVSRRLADLARQGD